MTSVAPASPCLVLQARFQVLPGAQSLHPAQVPRAAFPGSNAAQRGRRLPSLIALGPRAALGGPGRHRERGGWPPKNPEPPRLSQHPGRPTAGGSGRAGGSPVTGAASSAAGPRATSGRCDPPPPPRRPYRPLASSSLPSRAAAASSARAMSGCRNGARRERARTEGGRGAAAAAPRSGRSGDGPGRSCDR